MFGLLAALNSLPKQREGREALNYENYIRTGQGLPSTKIYRESSVDKQARKDLASIRYKERLQQQIKFIRLMKKLLIKIDDEDIDEELEHMRIKVAQLELKVEKSARTKDINCEDMFNMDKPDDAYDIELEQFIRTATSTEPIPSNNKKFEQTNQAMGDNITIQTSSYMNSNNNRLDSGDQFLIERIRKTN